MLLQAPRITAHLPRRGARASRRIEEERDRLPPRNRSPVSHEGLLPEFALLIAPRIDEPLVLLVRDLVPVDEVVVELHDRSVSERVSEARLHARHDNHLGWNATLGTKLRRRID